MEDHQIVELYFQRNTDAIKETDSKYGSYCFAIADNILHNKEDSEECVNDTWFRAWNAMPPRRPTVLRMFLAKITRNLSFNRFESRNAEKRGHGVLALGQGIALGSGSQRGSPNHWTPREVLLKGS